MARDLPDEIDATALRLRAEVSGNPEPCAVVEFEPGWSHGNGVPASAGDDPLSALLGMADLCRRPCQLPHRSGSSRPRRDRLPGVRMALRVFRRLDGWSRSESGTAVMVRCVGEDEFWKLIRILRGRIHKRRVDRLTAKLAKRPEHDILGFADRLAEMLYRLDTPEHAARDIIYLETGESLGMSDDSFLYLRAGIVAAGRKVYEQALAEPATMSTSLDLLDGEHLLYVATQAWENSTGLAWDHETPLSYETGSNRAAWGKPEDPDEEPYLPAWLQISPIYGFGAPYTDDHLNALIEIGDAIRDDPAWQQWWQPAGIPELAIDLHYDDEPRDHRVRPAKRRAQADIVLGPDRLTPGDIATLAQHAREDCLLALDLVRQTFALDALPESLT